MKNRAGSDDNTAYLNSSIRAQPQFLATCTTIPCILKRNVFFSQLKSCLVCSLQAQSLLQQYKLFTLGTVSCLTFVQSQIFDLSLNLLRKQCSYNSMITCCAMVYMSPYNLLTKPCTVQRRHSLEFTMTSYVLQAVVRMSSWCCWICLRLLTPSITRFFSQDCTSILA